MFSTERIIAEMEYIAPRMKQLGIVNLHLADTNFGMYNRDREICDILAKTRTDYGWPLHVMATTGKNNKDRIIEATKILGNTFSVNMSVQSMNTEVLKNINRDNIHLDSYIDVNKHLNANGRSTKGEVIIGLPGETRESFVQGIREILESGVSLVCCYSLMLLEGTRFKDPAYRDQFEIEGKYRIVPLDFGEYAGQRVFDIEETGIATKDMTFADYLWIRGFCLLIELLHNSRPFHELFLYADTRHISICDFIMRIYERIDSAPAKVRHVIESFLNETEQELWDSEDELIAHYQKDEHYQKLLKGEVGGNVIYKHKAMGLSHCPEEWVELLAQLCVDLVHEQTDDPGVRADARIEIGQVAEFLKHQLHGLLQADADISTRQMECHYDIIGWKHAPPQTPLAEFKLKQPIVYEFTYSDDQIRARQDQFTRYGTDFHALSKIVTRVSNVESLIRRVHVQGRESADISADAPEMFVRYSLSN